MLGSLVGIHYLIGVSSMKKKIQNIAHLIHPRRIAPVIDTFIRDESIGGKMILGAAVLSLIVVNSPLAATYNQFWHFSLPVGFGGWKLALDLQHWVNEGLMALFFLVVGLEIKRELVRGELRDTKLALLPIGAAIGGMVVPALIYVAFSLNTGALQGWGIPIATDIAFAIAILSLLGNRVPVALKVFLLTLAIADDIGAILVIALFYAEAINYAYLTAAFVLSMVVFVFRKQLSRQLLLTSLVGALLWVMTQLSGVHASIVGAIMGLLMPVATSASRAIALERVEKFVLPITTFLVLPLFAFANVGFPLNTNAVTTNQSILWGVMLGLVIGKVVGITLSSWLLVKLNAVQLPTGVAWNQIIGVGFIAGIGFTVSIFITELAFLDNHAFIITAKMGIFIASAVSALIGYAILRFTNAVSRNL